MNDANDTPSQASRAGMPREAVPQVPTVSTTVVGANMRALIASQFATTPLSMVVNALLARSLGAGDFGAVYLATTVLTLLFLFEEWGGQSLVAAAVARDRRSA